MILGSPWPRDLDPTQAGFKTGTETILRRHGYWDDPTRFDTLTAHEFLALEIPLLAVAAGWTMLGIGALTTRPPKDFDSEHA